MFAPSKCSNVKPAENKVSVNSPHTAFGLTLGISADVC